MKKKYTLPQTRYQKRKKDRNFKNYIRKMMKKDNAEKVNPELRIYPSNMQVGDIIFLKLSNPDTPIFELNGDLIKRLPVGMRLKYVGNKQNKYTKAQWKYFEVKDLNDRFFGIINPIALYNNIGYDKDKQEW